jgi:ferrous iron transport protein B
MSPSSSAGGAAAALPAAPEWPRIAVAGSPNSGKTTLFNALTGLRMKTGNYAGVTVDRREGAVDTPGGRVTLVDLPGTYSLHAISEDEAVAVRVLRGELDGGAPDAVVIVADVTTLDRSLPMVAEVLHLGLPALLCLTMIDELKARGGELDVPLLGRELGIPVVGVVGNRGIGVEDLRARLAEPSKWTRAKLLPGSSTQERFEWADALLARCTRTRPAQSRLTRRLDSVLLHPVLGPLAFLTLVSAFFQLIFTWAAPAMDFLSGVMDALADFVLSALPASLLTQLLADGIIRGVGAVIVFLPQILLLFTVLFLLEACGYMARAAFVVDRLMGWVGLEGRCFIALLSSYACAVPGILATRTIPSPRDRLATILVAPLTTCSARLPVYALLIAAFIPAEPVLGPFTWQGLTLLGLYLAGGLAALAFAALFKRGLLRGATLPFYLELPPYRFPSLKSVGVQVLRRALMFLKRAGTVILGVSVMLWALLSFPQRTPAPGATAAQARQQVIEGSLAASMGRAVEPLFAPLGFDWRITVGLIGSLAAREVVVSTLAQIYAHSAAEEDRGSLGAMLTAPDRTTGRPPLTRPAALALLAFFVFALQCTSTLAVMRRETGGWKWPAFAFTYMSIAAWLAGWMTHVVATALGA